MAEPWSTVTYSDGSSGEMTLERWARTLVDCRMHSGAIVGGELIIIPLHDDRNWFAHSCDWCPEGTPRPPVAQLQPIIDRMERERIAAIPPIKKHMMRERLRMTRQRRQQIIDQCPECQQCGATRLTAKLVVDHIVPVCRWGTSDDSNLQVLCNPCNQRKGRKERIDNG
jgi:HNH endonuclease